MTGREEPTGDSLADIAEFLETLYRKEIASRHHSSDYLGLGKQAVHYLKKRSGACCAGTFGVQTLSDRHVGEWVMTAQHRWQVGQWFYRMTLNFAFRQEFAMIAMNYFDRVLSLSNPMPRSKQEVELLALTCFYLAVKIYQAGPIFSTQQICALSGFVFPADQVAAMEQRILFALDWRLYPPCAADYVRSYNTILFCRMSPPPGLCRYEVVDRSLRILNAATLDYFFVAHKMPPSSVAAAALLNALRSVLPDSSTTPTVEDVTSILSEYAGCPLDEVQVHLCCERLRDIIEIDCYRAWSPTTGGRNISRFPPRHPRGFSSTTDSPVGVVAAVSIPSYDRRNMLVSVEAATPYY